MKAITQNAKAIQAKRDEIVGIKAEIERCEATLLASDDSMSSVNALKQQRKDILSTAFMAGTEPDTTEVDKLIRAAEKSCAAASDVIAGATGAKEVLLGRLRQTETELASLIDATQRLTRDECQRRFQEAEKTYSAATQSVGDALASMLGLLKVAQRVGGHSEMRSAMRDYQHAAAGLVENREGRIQIAEWADRIDRDLGNDQEAAILSEFEAAGLDVRSIPWRG